MKKSLYFLVLATFLSSSCVFAHDMDSMDMDSSSCVAVAKACKAAGYKRKDESKKFWKDCMKPLLMGQSVDKVNIDADKVKSCRESKIEQLEKELTKLKEVK